MNDIDYSRITRAALTHARELLEEWLPGGRVCGREYVALNPTRVDHHLGSFRINIQTGRWGDFATSARGGDFISLFAYINNISQAQAARLIASELGMEPASYERLRRARCG